MLFSKISKKIKISVIAISISIASLGLYSFSDDANNFEIVKNLDIYYTLFREINMFYVDPIDPGKLIKTSIDAMLTSLDPYTDYIPESQMEDFRFMTTGQYGGIGALIRQDDEGIVITDPYEGFPAQKAGLKAGDLVIQIDGKLLKGKTSSEVSDLLKGQPKTAIKLLIKRYGVDQPFEKEIVRDEIQIKSVPYYGMLNNEIGYIQLSSFTENATKEVKEALVELKEKNNAKAIVFDLRSNPGGLLIEAVNISNLFIEKGKEIVSTKGKVSQWDKSYESSFAAVDVNIPLVVLVNSGSASASEIVSGAIQDLDRGVVIGQRTYGKGLVQTTRQLSYNSKLKVTTAKYYIPSGRCIQALDYTHRNEDGSVGKVPDSLITAFKTKNGRKVFDGGGIVPDITTEPQRLSNISFSLIVKNHIFDYATQYALKNNDIKPAREYAFSEEEYKDFVSFLTGKDYDYETFSEEKLKELVDVATKEKYYDLSKTELDALQKTLVHDKNKDLTTFKDEIKELITEEIVSRYYYQKGRSEAAINFDPEVKKAIEVLKNKELYNSILNGTYKITETKIK